MLFQVFINRGLTPEQGREFLKRMDKEIDKNPMAGTGTHTVKIAGVTRYDDPSAQKPVFPDWLARALRERAGLSYDSVNLCYTKKYDTEAEAVAMMNWFDASFRPWLSSVFVAQKEILAQVQVRVMDEHADIAGSDSY